MTQNKLKLPLGIQTFSEIRVDILKLFDHRVFSNYWFETGTPTFLVNLLFKRQVSTLALGNMFSSASMLSSFDV